MIQPDLLYSVLCDEVRHEENGKWILLGLFEDWTVPALPFSIPRCSIINKWCNGEGKFTQQSRFVDSDDQILMQSEAVAFELTDLETNFTAVQVFGSLKIEKTGPIWVEVLLNGELTQRYVIRVELKPKSTGAGE